MTTKIPVELSSTPGIVDGSNATAITIDSSEDVTLAGNLALADSKIINIGDSSDLQLYHGGGSSYIKNDTGTLIVRADSFRVLNNANSEQIFHADADGAVTLYHNNAVKLATTSTGVDVTGNLAFASGNGIDFSATADGSGSMTNELLDDYEEGTWSPSLIGTTGSAGSYAQSAFSAHYRKVGGLCFINAHFYVTNKGSYTGNTSLAGLPFTNTGSTGQISLGSFPDSGYGTTSGNVLIAASILASGTEVRFYEGARLDGLHSYSDVGTGYYINIGGCYPVD